LARLKAKFDRACGVTGWTLHDLRRTARSLMSRAGVSADHAERCLGHAGSGRRRRSNLFDLTTPAALQSAAPRRA